MFIAYSANPFLPITVENLPFKGQGQWNMEPLSSVTGMC
jgi:hypothetical protein